MTIILGSAFLESAGLAAAGQWSSRVRWSALPSAPAPAKFSRDERPTRMLIWMFPGVNLLQHASGEVAQHGERAD